MTSEPLKDSISVPAFPGRSKDKIRLRLSKAIGHLNSVSRMIEGRSGLEVLNQLKAVQSALDGIAELLLSEHLEGVLRDTIPDEARSRKVDELLHLYKRTREL